LYSCAEGALKFKFSVAGMPSGPSANERTKAGRKAGREARSIVEAPMRSAILDLTGKAFSLARVSALMKPICFECYPRYSPVLNLVLTANNI
jgi:hypothetical protein